LYLAGSRQAVSESLFYRFETLRDTLQNLMPLHLKEVLINGFGIAEMAA
jgi:hypothetical protein